MRYERGAWASHFVCISFSLFFLLLCCILGRGQVLFGGKRCQVSIVICIKEQNENLIHVNRDDCWLITVYLFELFVFAFLDLLASTSLWLRPVRRRGVKRWTSHCFSGYHAEMFSLSSAREHSFDSVTMWLTNEHLPQHSVWSDIFPECLTNIYT